MGAELGSVGWGPDWTFLGGEWRWGGGAEAGTQKLPAALVLQQRDWFTKCFQSQESFLGLLGPFHRHGD